MFSYLTYAQEWGVKPSELGLCPPEDDPYMMIAFSRAKSTMEAYDLKKQKEEMERVQRRRGRS